MEQVVQGALAFPHKMSTDALQRSLDAFLAHDTTDRLSEIAAPTLVLAGGLDRTVAPYLGRVVADGIPGARFELLPEEGHRPCGGVQREGRRLLARG